MKKSIKIEVGDAASTAKGFIDAWQRAEIGEGGKTEHLLMFENRCTAHIDFIDNSAWQR